MKVVENAASKDTAGHDEQRQLFAGTKIVLSPNTDCITTAKSLSLFDLFRTILYTCTENYHKWLL